MGKDLPERELARSTDPHGKLWLVWGVGEGGPVFDHSVLEPMKRFSGFRSDLSRSQSC